MLTCILTLFSEMGSDPGYQLVEFYFERSKEISNSFYDDFCDVSKFQWFTSNVNGLLILGVSKPLKTSEIVAES